MFGSVSAVCPIPYHSSRVTDYIAWADKTKSTYDLPRPKEGTGSENVRGRTEILERKRRRVQEVCPLLSRFSRNTTLIIRLIEEDKQRQMAEMKGSLLGYIQGGSAPKPEEKKA
jgi:hypothetical protein